MSFKPRILFIDAYDSFSHNTIALLESECGVRVTKIYIDAVIPNFREFLTLFSAVVCGPGPGHPSCPQDVGLFKSIWALTEDDMLPTLGICLGFQSLAYEFGASIYPLPQPRHGIKTQVTSSSTSIFAGLPDIHTVQYHSLHAVIGQDTHQDSRDSRLWKPSELYPELQPLAWDFGDQAGMDPKFRRNPQLILMGIRHVNKPFYGVQFHPESILSERAAQQVVTNWWREAVAWIDRQCPPKLKTKYVSIPSQLTRLAHEPVLENKYCTLSDESGVSPLTEPSLLSAINSTSTRSTEASHGKLYSTTLPVENLTVHSICNGLNLGQDELIVLDSEMRQLPELGRFSIIGIVLPNTKKIKYSVGAHHVCLQEGDKEEVIHLDNHGGNIFSFVKAFMSEYEIMPDNDRAFCGGLMGYITYEACLETIGISASMRASRPDICFAFIEQSIVVDHSERVVHVQGLKIRDHCTETDQWLAQTVAVLKSLSKRSSSKPEIRPPTLLDKVVRRVLPEEREYKAKVAECQKEIGAGNSYELCLTDQTLITLAGSTPSWDIYLNLRRLNPAPFGAYIRLGPLTLLSTSPERFMNWSRFQIRSAMRNDAEPELFSTCQFRPIKGTVRKEQWKPDGSTYRIAHEEATAKLTAQKEMAENLMIVDLIRHDLYSVCRDVWAEELMAVEEYESVFQLVSVIEGKFFKPLHSSRSASDEISGVDCLAASLPPGSMTGAPKRRSCQILRQIENGKPRAIYSGVVGYICVSGKGDFSVVIRSMYQWDASETGQSTWNIGAGGAITSLSTEDEEWREMLTKLQSTYSLFNSKEA